MAPRFVITPEHVKSAREARRLGMTMSLTAAYIGISERQLYDWIARGEAGSTAAGGLFIEMAQAIKSGTSQGAALSLARIQKAAKGGIWQADAWIMERVHGYRATAPPEAPPRQEDTARQERRQRLRARMTQTGLLKGEE